MLSPTIFPAPNADNSKLSIIILTSPERIIYSDDETALRNESVQELFKDKGIKHIVTRSHAWFAERMIKTIKDMLYKRIDNSKDEDDQHNDDGD